MLGGCRHAMPGVWSISERVPQGPFSQGGAAKPAARPHGGGVAVAVRVLRRALGCWTALDLVAKRAHRCGSGDRAPTQTPSKCLGSGAHMAPARPPQSSSPAPPSWAAVLGATVALLLVCAHDPLALRAFALAVRHRLQKGKGLACAHVVCELPAEQEPDTHLHSRWRRCCGRCRCRRLPAGVQPLGAQRRPSMAEG